jgi:hypothetical protein
MANSVTCQSLRPAADGECGLRERQRDIVGAQPDAIRIPRGRFDQ